MKTGFYQNDVHSEIVEIGKLHIYFEIRLELGSYTVTYALSCVKDNRLV